MAKGQNGNVSFPPIGEVSAVLLVALCQLLPKATHHGLTPTAQRPSYNAMAGPLDGQPELTLGASCVIQSFTYRSFPALFLSTEQCSYVKRRSRARYYAANCARSVIVDLRVLRGLGLDSGHKPRLVAAGVALVTDMVLTMPIPSNLVISTFGAEVLRVNHKAITDFTLIL